jgi:hypothetical protein
MIIIHFQVIHLRHARTVRDLESGDSSETFAFSGLMNITANGSLKDVDTSHNL